MGPRKVSTLAMSERRFDASGPTGCLSLTGLSPNSSNRLEPAFQALRKASNSGSGGSRPIGSRGLRCSAVSSVSPPKRLSNHPMAEFPQVSTEVIGLLSYAMTFCQVLGPLPRASRKPGYLRTLRREPRVAELFAGQLAIPQDFCKESRSDHLTRVHGNRRRPAVRWRRTW